MIKLDKVNWGFIGCGEVTEKKSGPAFNMIEGSRVVAVMSRGVSAERLFRQTLRPENHPQLFLSQRTGCRA